MTNKWILGFLFLFLVIAGRADNNFSIRALTQKEGLCYDLVYNIERDRFGFLWIATWDGISRFDGYNFRNYKHTIGDTLSIPEFTVEDLEIDTCGNIWIKTISKVAVYNRKQDCFGTFSRKNCPTFKYTSVYEMVKDAAGSIWLAGDSGLSRFDQKTREFRYATEKCLDLNLYIDNKWNFYFGHERLQRYQLKQEGGFLKLAETGSFSFVTGNLPALTMINNYHFSGKIFQDNTGKTWAFTLSGVFLLDETKKSFVPWFQTPPFEKIDITFPLYWSENNRMLSVYSPTEKKLMKIPLERGSYPSACLSDNDGIIWFSTMDINGSQSGLLQCIETPRLFRHYLTDYDPDGQMVSVSGLIKDKSGNILVGNRNYNYIIKISPSGKMSKLNILDENMQALTKHPRAFAEDERGQIWIGYFLSLLSKYDPVSGKCSEVFLNESENETSFRAIHPVEDGMLMVGQGRLISLFNPKERRFIEEHNIGNYPYYCIFHSGNGYYWAGRGKGKLLRMNASLDSLQEYGILDQEEEVNIEEICETDSVYLWLATIGAGLCRFDRRDGSVKFYTTAQGLSDNVTYSVIKDDKNFLWISTNNGISRFDPVTENFKVFSEAEGLKIREFNADAAFRDENGVIFFGGQGGVVSFHPDSIRDRINGENPLLLLNNFLINGEYLKGSGDIYDRSEITLSKGITNFQAEMVCTDMVNSRKIRYRYQLEGIDRTWIETDAGNRKISYAGLGPDNYVLQFQATNPDGEWTIGNQLKIKILPFFYQTNLFSIILAFLLLGMVLLTVFVVYRQIRIKQLKEILQMRQIQTDLLRKNELLQLETLQGQMNPHFLFNSLNSINYFVSISDKISANQYITGFSRLVRSILNNSKSQYISLDQEIESLEDYLKLEHIRFSDKFEYEVEVSEELMNAGAEITPSMVQPFVENAIWHGIRYLDERKGMLRIKFDPGNNKSVISIVEDNGIGRAEAEKRKTAELKNRRSRGIEIIREKLKIFNSLNNTGYSITVSDLVPGEQEPGTRVVIEIPARFPEES